MATSYEVNRQKTKTPMPTADPVKRAKNFSEVELGYTAEQAVSEARRCIQCPDSPCKSGCPVQVPIPEFVEQVALGNFAEAYAYVKNANSLPAICGRVCPQETQCEAVCRRGRNGEPVGIGRLERFVADWAMQNMAEATGALHDLEARNAIEQGHHHVLEDVPLFDGIHKDITADRDRNRSGIPVHLESPALITRHHNRHLLRGKRVAMVGSGPASLTCANELLRMGAYVRMYEALHKTGGVLQYGIPEFRLPRELVRREIYELGQRGIAFSVDQVVGRLVTVQELFEEENFDAVFVGTGAGAPMYMGIEGEGLNGVMTANELLTRVNMMKGRNFPDFDTPVWVGKKCVVVGGGNVAMDAARVALRLGADVTVVYRRGRDEMPVRAAEYEHAFEEGVKFRLLTNPVRAIGDSDGWLIGVECACMELTEPDESGRRRPVPIEGKNFVMGVDTLVMALGNRPNPLISQTTPELETTKRGLIVTDPETCATSMPGVFAGGDIATGAATVIQAMGAGKRAAQSIAKYLTE